MYKLNEAVYLDAKSYLVLNIFAKIEGINCRQI